MEKAVAPNRSRTSQAAAAVTRVNARSAAAPPLVFVFIGEKAVT
jgi:hypothetical protein